MMENKILIVEDDDDISLAIKRSLERENYVVIRASDGYEALYKYLKEKPRMIILDVMLPKLNGYEVCREIRRVMNDERTPIIMVTGRREDYHRIKGRVVGATRYFTKPFELEKLMDEIRNLPRKKT
jgi:two-component system alkaline phosphatase synthesis response regulator PhoP